MSCHAPVSGGPFWIAKLMYPTGILFSIS
jgi:hypothetical protein